MLSELAKKIKLSSTLAISAKAKKMKNEGKDVVSFSAGEPDFDTPDFIKEAAIQAILSGKTKYTPATGIPELKNSIIEKFRIENNLEYLPEEIMVNCGAKHSLFNIIMCTCEKGDEVIIPAPYWVSYPEMVKAAGATPVIIDCLNTNFKLNPDKLKAALTKKTKLLIINSPSNPTGSIYSRDELLKIAEVAQENDLLIISDEIYEHLVYDKQFASIAAVSEEIKNRTIVVNGVSKAYSMTGWRIGYAAGNSTVISACAKLQSHSTSNPTSFAQIGAAAALTSPQSRDVVSNMAAEFKKRRDFIYDFLCNIDGITVNKPEGAFYIFPSIKNFIGNKISSSFDFAEKLLDEKKVAVVPGEGFGAAGYIRLSYASSMQELEKGLTRIDEFINEIKQA